MSLVPNRNEREYGGRGYCVGGGGRAVVGGRGAGAGGGGGGLKRRLTGSK